MKDLQPGIDSIFPSDKYSVTLTGTSIIFLEGTHYLVKNLAISICNLMCTSDGLCLLRQEWCLSL